MARVGGNKSLAQRKQGIAVVVEIPYRTYRDTARADGKLAGAGTIAISGFSSRRSLRPAQSAPDRPFPRCHALPAMPTLPSADEFAAPSPARIDYPEVLAAAIATFQASLVLTGRPALASFGKLRTSLGRRTFHGHGLLKSACVYRFRCRTGFASRQKGDRHVCAALRLSQSPRDTAWIDPVSEGRSSWRRRRRMSWKRPSRPMNRLPCPWPHRGNRPRRILCQRTPACLRHFPSVTYEPSRPFH
jgi:hypothetical protein